MTPTESFDAFASTVAELPISHLWRGIGSAIFIELGELSPRSRRDGSFGNPMGEVTLGVEWSWRIEDQAVICCGSWSDEDRWKPAFDLLRQARVARIERFGWLPEIAMTTDMGIRFISFSTTEGQPQWHLVDRRSGPARWFSVREGQLHIGDGHESSV